MWTIFCFVCVTGDEVSLVIPTDVEDQHKEAEWSQWLKGTHKLPSALFSIPDALAGSQVPTFLNDSTPVTKIGPSFILQIFYAWII